MRSLIDLSEQLNHSYSLEEVVSVIGNGTVRLSGADRAALFTWNEYGEISCSWSTGLSDVFLDAALEYARNTYPPEEYISPDPIFVPDVNELESDSIFRKLAVLQGVRAINAWPLVYEDRPKAFLCCLFDLPQYSARNEQEIQEAFSRQAAAAFVNAQLFRAERKQRQLAEGLRDVSAKLMSSLDLEEVLDAILNNLSQVLPHDAATIVLIEGEGLTIARSRVNNEEVAQNFSRVRLVANEVFQIRRMRETRQSMIVKDIASEPGWVPPPHAEWVRSYAGAPVIQHGEVTGFINVVSAQPGFFHPDSASTLQAFADQAAIALENARVYQHTRQRMVETSSLYRAIQPLFSPMEDAVALARQIAESVTQEFASAHCSVLMLNETRTHLVIVAQAGYAHVNAPPMLLSGPGLTVAAATTGKVIYSPDVTVDPIYFPGTMHTRSELAIPLLAGKQVIGVMNMESPDVGAFDERSQRILASFAEQAALGLENARLFTAIRHHAEQTVQLNEITRSALLGSDLNIVLNQIARQMALLIKADGCYITLWDEELQVPVPFAAYGPKMEIYSSLNVKPGQMTISENALKQEQTIVVEDIYSSPYISREIVLNYPVQSIMALPLLASQQKMGAVLVGFVDHHCFSPGEISIGEQAARQVALALLNLRSLDIAQRRAREAEILRSAAVSLSSTLDLEQVLDSILTYLIQLIPHDSAALYLVDGEDKFRRWGLGTGFARAIPRSDPIFQKIELGRQPVELPEWQPDPKANPQTGETKNWIGLPLSVRNEFTGVLALTRKSSSPFRKEEIDLLSTFSSHAAMAVENARLYQAAQQRALELEALHTATTSLVSTLDLQTLLERILSAAASAIPAAQSSSLHLLDDNKKLCLQVHHNLKDPESPCCQAKTAWDWVIEHHQPLKVCRSCVEQQSPGAGSSAVHGENRSMVAAPLIHNDAIFGVISLFSPDDLAFTDQDLHLLVSFASMATAALANAKLHSAVQALAVTDPLTQIYNRRGFYNRAQAFLDDKEHPGRMVSAIMLDIDFFKKINDQYGHDAGDAVLRELADRCRSCLRETDMICRYGGEEFAIVLPESNQEGAIAAANRLYHAVTDTPMNTPNGPVFVTISVGVATQEQNCCSLDNLLKLADNALYAAKREGRNQVCAWKQ